jgi:hypothetical protein
LSRQLGQLSTPFGINGVFTRWSGRQLHRDVKLSSCFDVFNEANDTVEGVTARVYVPYEFCETIREADHGRGFVSDIFYVRSLD